MLFITVTYYHRSSSTPNTTETPDGSPQRPQRMELKLPSTHRITVSFVFYVGYSFTMTKCGFTLSGLTALTPVTYI